jgi:large subunit ribosomal protein L1
MTTKSKRMKAVDLRVEAGKVYDLTQAVNLLKELSTVKFRESFDVSINLGVDPRKSDQVVRGSTVLPRGTGKTVRVAVFAEGAQAQAALDAGADIVGLDDLAQSVKDGEMNFDVVIATPSTMRVVGQLGQILGPKGLMPNPKVGTVAQDVAAAVKNAKGGQVRYRTDKAGIIHTTIGKTDFNPEDLIENLRALLVDLRKLKPSSAKGIYVKKITLSTTMGPGIVVDQASI